MKKIENIIFMGTPVFAVPSLQKLAESEFKPIVCITQPDRRKGRGKKYKAPPVKIAAENYNIPILQPKNVNSSIDEIEKFNPDIIVTVAYGGYIKRKLRKLPELGILNLHPSLLPKYRGAAPINFALFNGDEITGNTIFKLKARMDAGPILLQSKMKIDNEDYYTRLSKKLAEKGANDLLKALRMIESDQAIFEKQDETKATYSRKLNKTDMIIDWNKSAVNIDNLIRGLAVKPGAVSFFRNKRIKIIKGNVLAKNSVSKPGEVIASDKNGITVATGTNNYLIKELQPSGKKVMEAAAYNLGARIEKGELFRNQS